MSVRQTLFHSIKAMHMNRHCQAVTLTAIVGTEIDASTNYRDLVKEVGNHYPSSIALCTRPKQ